MLLFHLKADSLPKTDLVSQAGEVVLKAAPPLTFTGLTIYGIALPDIVGILTIIYLLIHIGYILKKWIKGE